MAVGSTLGVMVIRIGASTEMDSNMGVGSSRSLMVASIKGNTFAARSVVRACSEAKMAIRMMENSKTIICMAKAFSSPMAIPILANGPKERKKAKAPSSGQTGEPTKANGWMAICMALVPLPGLMAIDIKESGKMIICMAGAFLSIKAAINMKGNFKMTKRTVKVCS